jgi:hypothetical protein
VVLASCRLSLQADDNKQFTFTYDDRIDLLKRGAIRTPIRIVRVHSNSVSELCHMHPEPWSNTVIYADTLKHIAVGGSR